MPLVRLRMMQHLLGRKETEITDSLAPSQAMPILRFAATTAMLSSANTSGKYRYPFHKEFIESKEREMPEIRRNQKPDKPSPEPSIDPSVRLALTNDGMPSKESRYKAIAPAPEVRLAHVPGAQGDNNLTGRNGVEQLPEASHPALLVSYFYLKGFLDNQHKYAYRDWMLDSGAFSAYNSGKEINLQEYITECKRLLPIDLSLVEIIALDVIGSGPGSATNAEIMRDAGLDIIPVFHIGDDWSILKDYCQGYNKVGLSCRFGEPVKESYRFYEQCFARGWPKKFHSFGWVAEKMLLMFPFHSSDSADWEIKPCQFGTWRSFGKPGSTAYLNVRGSKQNLRAEVEWYLDLERRLQQRWKKEMGVLQALLPTFTAPTLRLAINHHGTSGERVEKIIGKEPTKPDVRLVVGTGRSVKDPGINALGKGEVDEKGT